MSPLYAFTLFTGIMLIAAAVINAYVMHVPAAVSKIGWTTGVGIHVTREHRCEMQRFFTVWFSTGSVAAYAIVLIGYGDRPIMLAETNFLISSILLATMGSLALARAFLTSVSMVSRNPLIKFLSGHSGVISSMYGGAADYVYRELFWLAVTAAYYLAIWQYYAYSRTLLPAS